MGHSHFFGIITYQINTTTTFCHSSDVILTPPLYKIVDYSANIHAFNILVFFFIYAFISPEKALTELTCNDPMLNHVTSFPSLAFIPHGVSFNTFVCSNLTIRPQWYIYKAFCSIAIPYTSPRRLQIHTFPPEECHQVAVSGVHPAGMKLYWTVMESTVCREIFWWKTSSTCTNRTTSGKINKYLTIHVLTRCLVSNLVSWERAFWLSRETYFKTHGLITIKIDRNPF